MTLLSICALHSGAQTLTSTYVELADSADRYLRQERWADAERVIVRALRHEPANRSNYLLWSNLGVVRTNMGDLDGALEALNIGLASAPRSTMLLSNRARTLIARGNTRGALDDLDAALELDSTLQWPRKMRGTLRAAAGDRKGAETDFAIYTARFGEDASVAEARGDLAASANELPEATRFYMEAYRLQPDVYLLTKGLLTAHLCDRLEEHEEALAEGLRKYPREGTLYLLRAMLNKRRYQNTAMEHDLKTARELGVNEDLYEALTRPGSSRVPSSPQK